MRSLSVGAGLARENPAGEGPSNTHGGGGSPREYAAPIVKGKAKDWTSPSGAVLHEFNGFHTSDAALRGGFQKGWGWRFPLRVPEAVIDWLYVREQQFYRWVKEFFT